MLSNGFKINECNKCVFAKIMPTGYVLVCLYVDDLLIIGSDTSMIKNTKKMLIKHFEMKDMGIVDVILGIKITRTSDGIILSQSHYVEKILDKFNKYDSSSLKTPIDIILYLAKHTGQPISQLEYSRIIGSLMYVMNCTRPEVK